MGEVTRGWERVRLFVSKSDYGIVTGCSQSGIDGARGRADDGEENRGEKPVGTDEDLQRRRGLAENELDEKGHDDSKEAAKESKDEHFTEKKFDDVQPREAERLEDADFTGALEHQGVHVEEDDEKTDHDADTDHGADKRPEFREIGRVHQADVFGHGANAIEGIELEDLFASAFRIAFAADVEHGDAFFGASDVLGGLERNEKAGAFAVGDDAADAKRAIEDGDGVADLEMTSLRDDVVGQGFIGRGKGTAVAIKKATAQTIEAFVVDAIDHGEVLLIHEDERGSGFVHARELFNLVAERFGHHGAGEREENGRVGRLDHDVGTDAFHAFAPL